MMAFTKAFMPRPDVKEARPSYFQNTSEAGSWMHPSVKRSRFASNPRGVPMDIQSIW